MATKKDQSGPAKQKRNSGRTGPKNPKGAKSDKEWRREIMLAVNELRKDPSNGQKVKALRLLARRLVTEALGGDVAALKEIGDRLDGRPAQIIRGDDDSAVPVAAVQFVFVDSDDESS